MNDVVLVGLIAGFFGVVIAAVPAIIAIRKQPTRRTTDAISLVDASGTVIGNLTDEIARLDQELDQARTELSELSEQLKRRPTREELLDTNGKLRSQLIDLGQIPANGH
jgi:hypothetical protein